jgi:hypothetical protein
MIAGLGSLAVPREKANRLERNEGKGKMGLQMGLEPTTSATSSYRNPTRGNLAHVAPETAPIRTGSGTLAIGPESLCVGRVYIETDLVKIKMHD